MLTKPEVWNYDAAKTENNENMKRADTKGTI